jgi:hypothetical protein
MAAMSKKSLFFTSNSPIELFRHLPSQIDHALAVGFEPRTDHQIAHFEEFVG